MHGELVHDSVLRGADVDAHELIAGGHLALYQFGALGLDLAQVLGHLAAQVLVDLDDLQLDLGSLALGLGDGRDVLLALAVKPCAFALERREARNRNEILVPQLADAVELALDQPDLPLLGLGLAGEPDHLVLKLGDPFPQLLLLTESGSAPQIEQALLAGNDAGDLGLVLAGEQIFGKIDLVVVVALRFQPGLARGQLVETLGDDRQVGARDRVVEADHDVARLDVVAAADAKLAHDPAGRMLHLLDAGIHHQHPRGDHRPGQLSRHRPTAQASGEGSGRRDRRQQVAPDRLPRTGRMLAHAGTASLSETTFRGRAGRASVRSTSSLRPNACTRPLDIARTRSTAWRADGRCAMTMTIAPRRRAAMIACVRASSPSASRFEFGSSRTTRNGSP